MKLSRHTQNLAATFMVTALALSSGCVASMPRSDEAGNRLVPLSSSESLVDELVVYAEQAGCIVVDLDTNADNYGRFVAHCPGGRLGVMQSRDLLSYTCPSLDDEACDRLMLRLAPTTSQRLPLVL